MDKANGVHPMIGTLEVEKDLTGGVRISLGPGSCVLSPQEATKYAIAVLTAAGINVKYDPPAGKIIPAV